MPVSNSTKQREQLWNSIVKSMGQMSVGKTAAKFRGDIHPNNEDLEVLYNLYHEISDLCSSDSNLKKQLKSVVPIWQQDNQNLDLLIAQARAFKAGQDATFTDLKNAPKLPSKRSAEESGPSSRVKKSRKNEPSPTSDSSQGDAESQKDSTSSENSNLDESRKQRSKTSQKDPLTQDPEMLPDQVQDILTSAGVSIPDLEQFLTPAGFHNTISSKGVEGIMKAWEMYRKTQSKDPKKAASKNTPLSSGASPVPKALESAKKDKHQKQKSSKSEKTDHLRVQDLETEELPMEDWSAEILPQDSDAGPISLSVLELAERKELVKHICKQVADLKQGKEPKKFKSKGVSPKNMTHLFLATMLGNAWDNLAKVSSNLGYEYKKFIGEWFVRYPDLRSVYRALRAFEVEVDKRDERQLAKSTADTLQDQYRKTMIFGNAGLEATKDLLSGKLDNLDDKSTQLKNEVAFNISLASIYLCRRYPQAWEAGNALANGEWFRHAQFVDSMNPFLKMEDE